MASARTIESSAAVGIARGGRVSCAPGIGPTRGRRYGSATSSARRQQPGWISTPEAPNRARSGTEHALLPGGTSEAVDPWLLADPVGDPGW